MHDRLQTWCQVPYVKVYQIIFSYYFITLLSYYLPVGKYRWRSELDRAGKSETQAGIEPMTSDYASGAVPSAVPGLTSSLQPSPVQVTVSPGDCITR